MLNKEQEILAAFVEKPWKKFTFKEIKEYSKKKSDSYVYNIIKKLFRNSILMESHAGNVILYSLNGVSEKSSLYAGMVSEHIAWSREKLPYDELAELMKKMPTNFYVLLVTGSYSSGKQTKKSDMDVVIICEDSLEPKKIYSELAHQAEISIPKIHLQVFKKTEFVKMLISSDANFGKETAKNNKIIAGGKIYFKIIEEAIKNGFTG